LPSGLPALALPAGSLSADDATQVFARFEETAVFDLAGSAPLEEVEAETIDDSPAPSSSADDDSIVDAEILEDEPDPPAYEEAASAQPWELPAGVAPNSPGADWTVADDDGFFFTPPTEESPYETVRIPTPSEVSAEVAAMFTDPAAEAKIVDEPRPAAEEPAAEEPAAEPFVADGPLDTEAFSADEPLAPEDPWEMARRRPTSLADMTTPVPEAADALAEVPAAYVLHEAPPLRAIPDVVTPRPAPTPPPTAVPVPPEPIPAPPAVNPTPPAVNPTPPQPIPAPPEANPTPPSPSPARPVAGVPGGGAMAEAARRPADLADHLRESRPADLSDYTAGRIPRMRRPAEEKPEAPRRPATLADHLSSRNSSEESTHDLRDHATRE
jgi:hypothetical protein